MHIAMTKKLADLVGQPVIEKDTANDMFAWHANCVTVLRKKMLVLMHDLSGFCIVLWGIKKSDFKDPIPWLGQVIGEAFGDSGMSLDAIMNYLDTGVHPPVTYGKATNRKLIGRLNARVEVMLWECSDPGVMDTFHQRHMSAFLNQFYMSEHNAKNIFEPKERMQELLTLL